MRIYLQIILLLGFAAAQIPAVPSNALAADLAVTPAKKAVIKHKRSRVVRDYDGTPIVLRRVRPVMVRDYDGRALVLSHHLHEAIPMMRATPTRYLNGWPVWPTNRALYWR
jgi:hypothetical protein